MDWKHLASKLFPEGHTIEEKDSLLFGMAKVNGETITVMGTTNHTPIGFELALAQAKVVLQTVREFPKRSILILIDTEGQRLRRLDEMLGINRAMAHLGKCLDLARRSHHKIIGLVYDQALSGGFITSGLMADACYALPESLIRVMGLAAMARITKVPEEKLTELAAVNPVFAPGPKNYERMGGIEAIFEGDLAEKLKKALQGATPLDRRSLLGEERGGRNLTHSIIQAVLNETITT